MLLVLAALSALGMSSARAQVPDAEARFVERIAQERQARGLPGYTVAVDLQDVARRHAQRMAERGEPYHNPNLTSEVRGWDLVGENVGRGWEADSLHQAFMDSPTHRDIILSSQFTEIGVGVVRTSDGQMWVVEVFRRPTQESATVAPAAAPPAPPPPPRPPAAPAPVPPAPAPAPAAPATTLPPKPAPTEAADETEPLQVVAGDELALAARSSVAAPLAVPRSVTTGAPELVELARGVPAPAWVAAFLLSAVVGGQALALRRLGLVA